MSVGTWTTAAARPLRGEVTPPGDKSISHRAVMLAAIADGTSRIDGFLEAQDTRATAAIMARLGVRIETPERGRRIVHGVGIDGLRAPTAPLDCGNSGTGMRLLAGLLVWQRFDSVLDGDASLRGRPMRRIAAPLTRMGARIELAGGAHAPIRIRGGQALRGLRHRPPVASAQVKSAILLAGLGAAGDTEVLERQPTRDYTERMLAAGGWPVEIAPGRVRLRGGARLGPADVHVPGDFSAAAFFIVAACLVPGSELLLRGVGVNPRRTGLLTVLRDMGADIALEAPREVAGEPVADLRVRHAPLRGIDVPPAVVGDMIDEFPALFVAAAAATGSTRIRGAAELRVKESDRIGVMADGLRRMGATIVEHPDGADISAGGALAGVEIDARGDHRIAMAFAVAGALARTPLLIHGCATVETSFPDFLAVARATGLGLAGVTAQR